MLPVTVSACGLRLMIEAVLISAAGEFDAVAVGIDDVEGALSPVPIFGWPGGLHPGFVQLDVELVDVVGGDLEVEARRSEGEKSEAGLPDAQQSEPGRWGSSTTPGMRW